MEGWLETVGLSWPLTLVVFAAFIAGGFTKGISGFGMPLVVVSLLSTLIPVQTALALNVWPPLILNLWQLGGRRGMATTLTRFWPVLAGMPFGTAIGAISAASLDKNWLIGAIGAMTLLFCAVSLSGRPFTLSGCYIKPVGFAAGITAGFTGALTTVNGPPLIMYLLGAQTDQDAFKASLGLFFLLGSTLLAIAFYSIGFLTPGLVLMGLAATLPAAAGMWLGKYMSFRMRPESFRRVVLVILAALGINLLRRALGAF